MELTTLINQDQLNTLCDMLGKKRADLITRDAQGAKPRIIFPANEGKVFWLQTSDFKNPGHRPTTGVVESLKNILLVADLREEDLPNLSSRKNLSGGIIHGGLQGDLANTLVIDTITAAELAYFLSGESKQEGLFTKEPEPVKEKEVDKISAQVSEFERFKESKPLKDTIDKWIEDGDPAHLINLIWATTIIQTQQLKK